MKDVSFPGAVLKERREALGHSHYSVSSTIHVPMEYLESFETGQFDKMPGRAYALGFLRSYCRFLDLDAESFADQYLLCTQPAKSGRSLGFMRLGNPSDAIHHTYPRWVNELLNWGTVCLFIIIGWIAYTTIVHPMVESWKGRVEAGAMEIEVPVHFNEDL